MEQYREIMAGAGIGPDDWRLMSFVFEDAEAPERFHYRLMAAGFMAFYLMFDCYDNVANVIVPTGEEHARRVQEIAAMFGGRKTVLAL